MWCIYFQYRYLKFPYPKVKHVQFNSKGTHLLGIEHGFRPFVLELNLSVGPCATVAEDYKIGEYPPLSPEFYWWNEVELSELSQSYVCSLASLGDKLIAIASDNKLGMWSLSYRSGRNPRLLFDHKTKIYDYACVRYNANINKLAYCNYKGAIQLWTPV